MIRSYLKDARDQRIWDAGRDRGWRDREAVELGVQTKKQHAIRIGITLFLLAPTIVMVWAGGAGAMAAAFFAFFAGVASGEALAMPEHGAEQGVSMSVVGFRLVCAPALPLGPEQS